NIVHDSAHRHALQRHSIALLHVRAVHQRDYLVAGGQPLGGKDIGLIAVLILDQCEPGSAVRVIFESLAGPDYVEFHTLEVAQAIAALMTAVAMIGGDAATIIAATALGEAFGQSLDRVALPQIRTIGRDQRTPAFGGSIVSL